MLLLVNKGHASVASRLQPGMGRLVQPRNMDRMFDTDRTMWWAADNDAFNGFHEDRFLRMLNNITSTKRLLFITAPDVVAEAQLTLQLFDVWQPTIRTVGPVALVLQDGMTTTDIPWDRLDAVFVGGTTEYKLGEHAARIVHAASERGKWCHMGRVNTRRRLLYAKSVGCDSVDGTALSMFTDTYLSDHLEVARSPKHLRLFQ